jgi:hypothetical protein
MNSFARHYTQSLYPFQDGILRIVQGLALPFYLTGGTVLSRHYFAHRYSDLKICIAWRKTCSS